MFRLDHPALCGPLALLGRVLLCFIIFTAAVGHHIPDFEGTAKMTGDKGVPFPQVALALALLFMVVGSVTVVVGYHARLGALLLAVFLVLAAVFFHNFWDLPDGPTRQGEMNNFLKNISMTGAMLLIVANGPGPWSLDQRR